LVTSPPHRILAGGMRDPSSDFDLWQAFAEPARHHLWSISVGPLSGGYSC
jgi:hypothetical protein